MYVLRYLSGLSLKISCPQNQHKIFVFLLSSNERVVWKTFVNLLLCFHSHLPKIYQSFLMSATFTEDVQALKELLLHNPVRSPAPTPPADTRHDKSSSHTLIILCVQCCSVWFGLHAWFCSLSGHPEASGLSAPRRQSAAAVQHQM